MTNTELKNDTPVKGITPTPAISSLIREDGPERIKGEYPALKNGYTFSPYNKLEKDFLVAHMIMAIGLFLMFGSIYLHLLF